MNTLHAVPAYGRKYKNNLDLFQAWLDGKDFRIEGGSYFSIRDHDALINTHHYDMISVKHEDAPIASVCYIPLFKQN